MSLTLYRSVNNEVMNDRRSYLRNKKNGETKSRQKIYNTIDHLIKLLKTKKATTGKIKRCPAEKTATINSFFLPFLMAVVLLQALRFLLAVRIRLS